MRLCDHAGLHLYAKSLGLFSDNEVDPGSLSGRQEAVVPFGYEVLHCLENSPVSLVSSGLKLAFQMLPLRDDEAIVAIGSNPVLQSEGGGIRTH